MGSSLRRAGVFRCSAGSLLQRAGFSLVVACGFSLSSCGTWAPGHVGSVVCSMRALSLRRVSSVVVAHGLCCPAACGVLVPRPRIEPASPAMEGRFFTTRPLRKSLKYNFKSWSFFEWKNKGWSGSRMSSLDMYLRTYMQNSLFIKYFWAWERLKQIKKSKSKFNAIAVCILIN